MKWDITARRWFFQPSLAISFTFLTVFLYPILMGLSLLLHVWHFFTRVITARARHSCRQELGILIEEMSLAFFPLLESRSGMGCRIQLVSSNPRRLMPLGLSFYLLKVAILPQLQVDLVLLALLAIESLIEFTLGVILAYLVEKVLGGGRSFTFLRCWSKKPTFLVTYLWKLAVPSWILR